MDQNAPAALVLRRAYTMREGADILQLSLGTVKRLIREGKIKAPRVSLKKRLIPNSEIERILSVGIDAPIAA
ncbi:MAG: helix-turn-helix domain-containing protein [Rhizobiales bacterium]|nr:helix-turn-helix domain-containing protein [Hyphomicrobiales bacterium]